MVHTNFRAISQAKVGGARPQNRPRPGLFGRPTIRTVYVVETSGPINGRLAGLGPGPAGGPPAEPWHPRKAASSGCAAQPRWPNTTGGRHGPLASVTPARGASSSRPAPAVVTAAPRPRTPTTMGGRVWRLPSGTTPDAVAAAGLGWRAPTGAQCGAHPVRRHSGSWLPARAVLRAAISSPGRPPARRCGGRSPPEARLRQARSDDVQQVRRPHRPPRTASAV